MFGEAAGKDEPVPQGFKIVKRGIGQIVIDEKIIRLIGDHEQVLLFGEPGDALQVPGGIDGAGGIVGGIDQYGLRFSRNGRRNGVEVQLVVTGTDKYRLAAGQFDLFGKTDPARHGNDDLITGVTQGLEDGIKRLLGSVEDHDVLGTAARKRPARAVRRVMSPAMSL